MPWVVHRHIEEPKNIGHTEVGDVWTTVMGTMPLMTRSRTHHGNITHSTLDNSLIPVLSAAESGNIYPEFKVHPCLVKWIDE